MANTVRSRVVRAVVQATANVGLMAKACGSVVVMTDGMEWIVPYRWNKIVMTTRTTIKVTYL